MDEGIFATAGLGLTRGLILYRDVWDQKPPGVHLTYAAGFALFGATDHTVLFLDAIAATIACALVFAIALRLRSDRSAWAAAVAFAIGTYPAFALPYGGFLERAVPETFITALAAAAAWCAISSRFALAGIAIGAAAIFKPTALVYWPLIAALPHPASRTSRLAVSGATLLIPIAAVLLWLAANGALGDAKIAVIDYNRGYVVAGAGWFALPNILAHEIWRLVKTDPLWAAAAVAGVAGIWDLGSGIRDSRKPEAGSRKPEAGSQKPEAGSWELLFFSVAWLSAAVIAVAANGVRMYATYFLPTAPPLALLVGSLFGRGGFGDPPYDGGGGPPVGRVFRPGVQRGLLRAAAVVLAGAVAVRSHYPDRLLRYTAADIAQLRGTAPRAAYLEMFGGYANGRGYSARANDELASYLRAHSGDDDRVYIFGMAPAVYFDARRLPADRFVWTFPAVAPFTRRPEFTVNTLAADIDRAAPRYLVLERNNRDSATGWRIEDVYASPAIQRVFEGYTREREIEDFTVMRRR